MSLRRIQEFDPNTLVRRDDLGAAFEFSSAVGPAQRLISLFSRLPVSGLEVFASNELVAIQNVADSVYHSFEQILGFDPQTADSATKREALISGLVSQYQSVFSQLHPLIAFSVARTANFLELAEEGRATVQSIQDQVDALLTEIARKGGEADTVLDEIRRVSAERGVSQEAFHFSKQADTHKTEADIWRKYTVRMSIALGVYSFATIFLHRIPWLSPVNQIETAQFVVSKVLIFGVLAYMLGLCAKNFLSHKHNELVNRHRQNALMTYKSLVNASATPESRDIVLQQAATAIYQLHDTGYVKSGDQSSRTNLLEVIPRTTISTSGGGTSQ